MIKIAFEATVRNIYKKKNPEWLAFVLFLYNRKTNKFLAIFFHNIYQKFQVIK